MQKSYSEFTARFLEDHTPFNYTDLAEHLGIIPELSLKNLKVANVNIPDLFSVPDLIKITTYSTFDAFCTRLDFLDTFQFEPGSDNGVKLSFQLLRDFTSKTLDSATNMLFSLPRKYMPYFKHGCKNF